MNTILSFGSALRQMSALLAADPEVARHWESGGVLFLKGLGITVLVILNGFFVASEFSLVKVRGSQLDALVEDGEKRAASARQVLDRLDSYLSATQLGVTLASLALGLGGRTVLLRTARTSVLAHGHPVGFRDFHDLGGARGFWQSRSCTSSSAN